MNPIHSLHARRRLRVLCGLAALIPAVAAYGQSSSGGSSGGDGGAGQGSASSGSGTDSGSGGAQGGGDGGQGSQGAQGTEGTRQDDARADAMSQGDARAEAMRQREARAEAMRQRDARAEAMRERDVRSRAMEQGDARAEAMEPSDARARAMGAEGAQTDAARERDDQAARDGTSAVTDLPPGVTSGAGGAVSGGVGRRSTSEGAAIGDGMRLNDGGLAIDDQAQERRDPAVTARMIGETSFAFRDRAMTMAEREMNEGTTLSSALERGAANVSGLARTRLNDSIKRLNAARTEFAKAISRGRASNENRWEDNREELVERYNDYVKAQEEALEVAHKAGATVDEPGRLPAPPVLR